MKKILNTHRAMSTRDDFPLTGGHIPFVRICAFATEGGDFTEEENTHFDACRYCRLKMIEALRSLAPSVERTITAKAA
jgi:hypothetical protein